MAAERLIIRGLSTISPLGSSRKEVSQTLTLGRAKAQWLNAAEQTRPVFPLTASGMNLVEELSSQARYQGLDRTTLLALTAARQTFAALRGERMELGCISIGSARGATNSLERSIAQHLAKEGTLAADTSPTTTAGNTTSWIAQEYLEQEYLVQEDLRAPKSAHSNTIASISTSMTCTSAFHALLIATAFLRGGMASAALFGGAESCLTSYTVAQLEALRIYSRERSEWPCRPCASSEHSSNTLVLGEGAGTAILLGGSVAYMPGDMELLGIGWALEATPSATGISEDGRGFQGAMLGALAGLPAGRVLDGVIMHAPGTSKGDEAELRAIEMVLGSVPLCSTKHLTGHTYGASGMISLATAQVLLSEGGWSGFPYPARVAPRPFEAPRTLMINTAGFGGNAISIVVGAL